MRPGRGASDLQRGSPSEPSSGRSAAEVADAGISPYKRGRIRRRQQPAAMCKLIDAIERHPAGAFAAFLALHAAVWTALPALFFLNLPLDLIEALVYGREWQLGYDKLPPLPWWMVEAAYRLFGPDLFYYLLAQADGGRGLRPGLGLARPLVGAVGALVAILIIDGLHYFTFTAPKFNHDVVQLPFWALAGFAYWAALRRGRTVHWVLLGLGIGTRVLGEVFRRGAGVPLALFVLLDRDARRTLATPGPWIAVAVALVVMAPHLVWLVQNDFLPFAMPKRARCTSTARSTISSSRCAFCCRSRAFWCRRC